MRKILRVAQREYIETVKTKTFLLGVLMTPILIGGIVIFSVWSASPETASRPDRKIGVTDLSDELADEIKAAFDAHNTSHPRQKLLLEQIQPGRDPEAKGLEAEIRRQKQRLRSDKLDVFVVLDEKVVAGEGKMRLYSRPMGAADLDLLSSVEGLLNRVVVHRRCKLRNLSPELLAELRRRVPTEHLQVGRTGGAERVRKEQDTIVDLMAPFFFVFMMFMGVFGMGQHMVTSIIEEKSSRVIEVLLSALSPFELMSGKILGLAGIGLTVVSLWCAAAIGAVVWRGLQVSIPAGVLGYFVVYYLLGFLLLSSILAGVGSICNTIKEAQSLLMPLTLLFVLPMVAWLNLVKEPDGLLARVLSFVPPLTPLVMVLRLAASPDLSLLEIWASILVLAASVPAVMWAAAKVFRTGILLYGKRPGLREVLRWIRQS